MIFEVDIIEELEKFKKIDFKMGYFKESSKLKINNSVDSIIYKFDDKIEINHNVRVNYYAGAFSTFHTGHLNCIRYVYDNEIKIDDNFIIVISRKLFTLLKSIRSLCSSEHCY